MPGITTPPLSETDPDSVTFPPIFRSHIDNCQFSSWYKEFSRFAPKARVISDLPEAFIKYLLEDGIILPPENNDQNSGSGATTSDLDSRLRSRIEDLSIDNNGDDENRYSDEDEQTPDPTVNFKELHKKIGETIEELGGSVIPKLNWSTPKDATWISLTNSLKCNTPSDIYLMLKSSSFITHDLVDPYNGSVEATEAWNASPVTPERASGLQPSTSYELVLRQWFDLNPALEFRCFVRNRVLICISQRDYLKYYPFLSELKDSLGYEIEEFFENYLQRFFPDENFVFDVYIPEPYDRVYLIDINPFAPQTDPLLFTWYEILHKLGPESFFNPEVDIDPSTGVSSGDDYSNEYYDYEFRLVEKSGATSDLLGGGLQHSENRVPKDIVDASLTGEGIAELARQWNAMLNGEGVNSTSDEGDDGDDEKESDSDD